MATSNIMKIVIGNLGIFQIISFAAKIVYICAIDGIEQR